MLLLAAMAPPGGGRTSISQRLQSRFNLINVAFPHESQIRRIFSTLIGQKLEKFDEDVKPLGDIMTQVGRGEGGRREVSSACCFLQATIEVYNSISTKMLPTLSKMLYQFNLRDISKVSHHW